MDAIREHLEHAVWQSDPMPSDFYGRVVEAFDSAGLDHSQSAIARQLGLGQSAVAKWAHGNGYPTLRKCIQIAVLTGVGIEWLMTGRGSKKEQTAMDALTQRLLEEWAKLPADKKRATLDFVRFQKSQTQEPSVVPPDHGPKPSDH
jgi:transcriptional regulator with XRE-family HTH domain